MDDTIIECTDQPRVQPYMRKQVAMARNTVRVFRIDPTSVQLQIRGEKNYATQALTAEEARKLANALLEGAAEVEATTSYFRFSLVCPSCNKSSSHIGRGRANPRINCGECLMNKTEVVELKVVDVKPEAA